MVSFIAVHRYLSYQSSWDLGVFTQIFEGLLKLGFMYDTMDFFKNPSGNYLGVHFSPFIIILTPFYYVMPTPATLLITQVLFYSAGVVPLYLMAKKWFDEISSILISLAYLIHPGSLYLLLYDFHEISLFPTLFIFTMYFYFTKQYLLFLLLLILSCMVNEFTPILMLFFSLYLFIFNVKETQKRELWGMLKKLGALKEFRDLKKGIINKVRSDKFPLLAILVSVIMIAVSFYIEHLFNPIWRPQRGWIVLGSSLEEILLNLVTRPDLVLKSLTADAKLKLINLIYLFGPYLLLPFFSGFFLLVLAPWMIATLLSLWPICTIYLQYHAMNMPLLIIATIIGIRRLSSTLGIKPRKIIAFVFLVTLIFTSLIGPLGLIPAPYGYSSREQIFGYRIDLTRKTRHDIYDLFIDLIPADSVVLTQVRFYSHLSDKTPYVLLYIPPENWDFYDLIPFKEKLTPKYILLDFSEESFKIGFSFKWKDGAERYVSSISSAEKILDDEWGVLAEFDSIVLYKRGFKGSPLLYGGFTKIYDSTKLIYKEDNVAFYEEEKIIEFSGGKSHVFWYGPYDFYPPGIYNVTFVLRVKPGAYYNSASDESALTLDVAANEGKIIIASRKIRFNELSYGWRDFTIQFKVPIKPLKLEFRGLYPHPNVPIQLQKIIVERIAPINTEDH
ncbi:MAG: DUF2079 domain-containing protein [Candidatus Bathyarchaeia archaeon]